MINISLGAVLRTYRQLDGVTTHEAGHVEQIAYHVNGQQCIG